MSLIVAVFFPLPAPPVLASGQTDVVGYSLTVYYDGAGLRRRAAYPDVQYGGYFTTGDIA